MNDQPQDICPTPTPDPKQRWLTFVRNHAKIMVACDFFVVSRRLELWQQWDSTLPNNAFVNRQLKARAFHRAFSHGFLGEFFSPISLLELERSHGDRTP